LKTENLFSVLRCEMLLRNMKYVPRETAGHMKYSSSTNVIDTVTYDVSYKACVEVTVSVQSGCSDAAERSDAADEYRAIRKGRVAFSA
ncbi:MAG: hypothetical protein IKZ98_13450, partial [Clostridia bacterium]|nr:hypothetical protein [Clostridia bacterium]